MIFRCHKANYLILSVFCGFLFTFSLNAQQNRLYGDQLTLSENVANPDFVVDADFSNFATLSSNSGVIGGVAADEAIIEIAFDQPLVANQTTYVRLDFEDDIFNAFLGGSFGVLLSDVLGTTLLDNHILEIEARNGRTTVLRGETSNASDFTGEALRVVVDVSGDFFLKITPDVSYDRIWIKDRTAAIVGLGVENQTLVYYAFTFKEDLICSSGVFTGFEVSGLNVGAFSDEAPVTDLALALDNNPDTYSQISLGNLSPSGSIRQDIYFNAYTHNHDQLSFRIRLDPDLIEPELINAISIRALDGSEEVYSSSVANLISDELLTDLENGGAIEIPFFPHKPVNRVAIQFEAGSQVSNEAVLEFSGVTIIPPQPTSGIPDGESFEICAGTDVEIAVVADGAYLIRWYDRPEGGEILAITAAGESFNPGILEEDRTFYAVAYAESCDRESSRLAVEVSVIPSPSRDDLVISGNQSNYCEGDVLEFLPLLSESSSLSPNEVKFTWYKSNDKLDPILDGDEFNGGEALISENGLITLTGVMPGNYSLFLSVTNGSGCENTAGQLLTVDFQISVSASEVEIQVSEVIICEGDSYTLTATVKDLKNPVFRFYSDEALTDELTELTVSPTHTTTYYVTVEGNEICPTPSIPSALLVTVNSTVAPVTSNPNQEFCENDTITLAGIAIQGENIRWYETGNSQSALASTTPLVDGQTYFASQTVNGCESKERTAISIVLNNCEAEFRDLEIVKTASVEQVLAGGQISYSILIANPNSLEVTDLTITDVLDESLTFVSATQGGTSDNGTVTWSIPSIPAESQVSLSLTVTVQADIPQGTSLSNRVVAIPSDPDANRVESDPAIVLVVGDMDETSFAIVKSVNHSTANPGDKVIFTIRITNTSTSVIEILEVKDDLAQELEFVEASNNGIFLDGIVSWEIENLEAGQSIELLLTTSITTNAISGQQISNLATATLPDGEQKESDRASVLVLSAEDDANTTVNVIKTQNLNSAFTGDLVTYTITIRNEGEFSAENLELKDILPPSVMATDISGSGIQKDNEIIWVIPSLAPADQLVFIVQVMVTAEEGSIVNQAKVSGDNFPEASDQTNPILIGRAVPSNLAILKEVSKSMIAVGQDFEYKLSVSNKAGEEAAEIVVTDTLPSEVEYLSSSATAGTATYSTLDRLLVWSIDSINSANPQSLIVKVRASVAGEITNRASVASSREELDAYDNQSSVTHQQLDFIIPNVISPNGDGINDTWEIPRLTEFFTTNQLVIVNRYGVEVFRASDYQNDWDGDSLASGTYFYTLSGVDQTGTQRSITGFLTIIN